MFKLPEGYFLARSGTHILWRLGPITETPVCFETSEETGEVVRWYLTSGSILGWLMNEAGLARDEARQRQLESDKWYEAMAEQMSKSPPAAKPSPKGKGAAGR